MKRRGLLLVIGAIALGANGCASVTFKRGATPDTMAVDEGACRTVNPTDEEFHSCMREKGWFVAEGRTSKAAHIEGSRRGANDSPASKVIDFSGKPPTASPTADRAVTITPASREAAATTSVAKMSTSTGVDTQAISPPDPDLVSLASVSPPAGRDDRVNPDELVAVASWWKFGGTAGGLDEDIDACVGTLGERHRPEPAARRVTSALGGCLRDRGWYAVGK